MRLSTRNQLDATVTSVQHGEVMSMIKVDLNGQSMTAAITRESAEELGLAAGDKVKVLVKATEVMLGKE